MKKKKKTRTSVKKLVYWTLVICPSCHIRLRQGGAEVEAFGFFSSGWLGNRGIRHGRHCVLLVSSLAAKKTKTAVGTDSDNKWHGNDASSVETNDSMQLLSKDDDDNDNSDYAVVASFAADENEQQQVQDILNSVSDAQALLACRAYLIKRRRWSSDGNSNDSEDGGWSEWMRRQAAQQQTAEDESTGFFWEDLSQLKYWNPLANPL